jgi:hypothetical protein
MSAISSPRFYEILLPEKGPSERPAFRKADRGESDWFTNERRPQRPARLIARLLVMFLLGAVAAVAWQSYSHAAREMLAGLSPQLRWVAPPAEAVETVPDRYEQITRSVDRLANDIAASRDQTARSIDHLAAGQEQMTRELVKLHAVSQHAKSPEPPSRPAPVQARKAGQQPSQAR